MNKNHAKMLLITNVVLIIAAIVKIIQTGDSYYVLPLTFGVFTSIALVACLIVKADHV